MENEKSIDNKSNPFVDSVLENPITEFSNNMRTLL